MAKRFDDADHPVTTHSQEADVVEENDAGEAIRICRLAKHRSYQNVRPSWLLHDSGSKVIELGGKLIPLRGQGTGSQHRPALDDHASRFAGGMRIDHTNLIDHR